MLSFVSFKIRELRFVIQPVEPLFIYDLPVLFVTHFGIDKIWLKGTSLVPSRRIAVYYVN